MCHHTPGLFSQTITRAVVTYKKESPHGPLGRKRSQTTIRVGSRIWASTDTEDGWGLEGRGGVNALTFSVEPGLSRSSSLHRTSPSFREFCRNASGSEMVFFGDSSTPSVINHVTVCSAEFMSSHNRSKSNKAAECGGDPELVRLSSDCASQLKHPPKMMHRDGRWGVWGGGSLHLGSAGGKSAGFWFPFSLRCRVFFPPRARWAVNCGSLWCVEASDCIHAHHSRQPLIHWMTSHKRDQPVVSRTWIGFFPPSVLRVLVPAQLFYPPVKPPPQAICCYLWCFLDRPQFQEKQMYLHLIAS